MKISGRKKSVEIIAQGKMFSLLIAKFAELYSGDIDSVDEY
jgi:hypothetical protein